MSLREIGHYIDGKQVPFTGNGSALFNPANGKQIGRVKLATKNDVDAAVAAATKAQPSWSRIGLQTRSEMMLNLRDALKSVYDKAVMLITDEAGKTLADARAEVDRTIEILAQASSVGNWYGARSSPGVSRGVDTVEMRFPIGVVAGISPFNFPIMIPVLQAAISIVCGNTFVIKPSEKVPSCCVLLGNLFNKAEFPDGVFNVVNGDRLVVDRLLEHPDVAGISFVGSTNVARQVRKTGVENGKRVQAFGSGKNHLVILPDADLDLAADAAVSSAYGAAGQRCMAVSVVVTVGDIADTLVDKIADRISNIKMGDPTLVDSQLGPVISSESCIRISNILDRSVIQGANIIVDGRKESSASAGWFMAPTLVDHVQPGMDAHSIEIFGPVLSVVRTASYDQAMAILNDHALGNGAAIFTRDGGAARRFVNDVEAGQVGVNIPIPFPVFFHSFGGWKDSAFTETKLFGPDALNFCTRIKTVSTRWPEPSSSKVDLGFPSSK